MIRHNPSSSINQAFEDISVEEIVTDDLERLKKVGPPLFTEDDIYPGMPDLVRMFRKFCVTNRITKAYFDAMYTRYAINVLHKLPNAASNNLANAHKTIMDPNNMTYKKYCEMLINVLGFRTEDITHVLRAPSGKIQRITLED